MIAKARNPAPNNPALGNVAVAGIWPFITDIALAHLFQPVFGTNAEIANAGRFFPLVIAQPVEKALLFTREVCARHCGM